MPSAIVEIREGAGSWVSADDGVNVAAGSLVSIRLQDSNVTKWQLECFGVDEVTATKPTLSDVNPTDQQVTTPATIVTFTVPTGTPGRAFVFRSRVNGGGTGLETTFGIFKLTTQGDRVGAAGETREGSREFGWTTKLNPLIRTAGGGGGGDLPALANLQYAILMEDPAGTLVFQRATLDMLLPAFAISAMAKTAPNSSTTLYRRGDAIAINGSSAVSVSMSYTATPDAANMADGFTPGVGGNDVVSGGWPSLITPFTSATRSGSIKRNGSDLAADPTLDLILTATKGTNSKQSSIRITWTRDVYWGIGSAGQATESFIEALTGTALSGTKARTIVVHPVNQKVYYASPKAYGTVSFTLNGFPVAMNAPVEVQVTNTNSVQSTYYLYETVNLLTQPDSSGLSIIAA